MSPTGRPGAGPTPVPARGRQAAVEAAVAQVDDGTFLRDLPRRVA